MERESQRFLGIWAPTLAFCALVLLESAGRLNACDLCAIYRATNARGESSAGFLMTLSEQYISYGTLQQDSEPAQLSPAKLPLKDAFLDTSITHVVPAYNFSDQFGLSLNIPLVYRDFDRIQYDPYLRQQPPDEFGVTLRSPTPSERIQDESGSLFGLGDISLVARYTPLRIAQMKYSIVGTLFGGVKFPTGDTERLDRELEREHELREIDSQLGVPPDAPVHNHVLGGIHQHDLTLGSGSFDGIFGTALTLRWDRWFLGMQGQYYLRSQANGYRFGDEIIVSGGPGAYLFLGKGYTFTLQANAVYDTMAADEALGLRVTETGWTAWFFGPQLNFTWGDHFSVNAGVDIPLHIQNNGLQSVPDFRFHGGVSWRF